MAGMRQGDLDCRRPGIFQPGAPLPPQRIDLRRHPLDPILARNADLEPANILAEGGREIRHRHRRRGRIAGIVADHALQQHRRIAHGARHRTRLVEAGSERDDTPARAATVGRLDAHNAAERGRLADRAAGIGPGGGEAKPGRDCRR